MDANNFAASVHCTPPGVPNTALSLSLRLVQVHHHPRELHQHRTGQLRVLHQRRRRRRELVQPSLEPADVVSHVEEVLVLHDTVGGHIVGGCTRGPRRVGTWKRVGTGKRVDTGLGR